MKANPEPDDFGTSLNVFLHRGKITKTRLFFKIIIKKILAVSLFNARY